MNRGNRSLFILFTALMLVAGGILKCQAQPLLYWTENAANRIRRANLDGTNAQTVVSTTSPHGVAVDPFGGRIYWTEPFAIRSATLNGSDVQTVISSLSGDPWGIDVDVAGRKIYFTDAGRGDVGRMNLDGTSFELLTPTQGNPIGIDVDHDAGKMYWVVALGQGGNTDGTRRANLDGSGIVNTTSSQGWPLDLTLDIPKGKMYVTDQTLDTIKVSNLDGSNLTVLTSGLNDPFGIDLAGDNIYWVELGSDTLRRINKNGTGLTTILTNLNDPQGLAVFEPVPEPSSTTLLALAAIFVSAASRRLRL
jgi:DNA-binding beta-propeller fold protein YncE